MGYLTKYFLRMTIFLALVAAGTSALFVPLTNAFKHNIWLNGTIVSVFFIGVLLAFSHFFRLRKEQQWLDAYDRGEEKFPNTPQPKILAPLSVYLDHQQNAQQSSLSINSILSSIEMRLEESRDMGRYLIGLMIFLGLLGTFWGLSQTIGAITGVITGIDIGANDIKQAFDALKHGLQSPLAGMGTAFSCSMFGLAASMILGFLDITVAKAGSAFFHRLEEKLTPLMNGPSLFSEPIITHPPAVNNSSGPAYIQSLLEQTTENMTQLYGLIRSSEDNRTSVVKLFQGVGEKISLLTEQMSVQQLLLHRMAQNQVDLQDQLSILSQALTDHHNKPTDEGIKEYLRNLDTTSLRLLEEVVEGRGKSVQEIRNEIRLVAKTISALADGQDIAAA